MVCKNSVVTINCRYCELSASGCLNGDCDDLVRVFTFRKFFVYDNTMERERHSRKEKQLGNFSQPKLLTETRQSLKMNGCTLYTAHPYSWNNMVIVKNAI